MRLIDADALVKELSGKYIIVPADEAARGVAAFMGIQTQQAINNAPTIETVPLEDYRSMEQTVHKLTQALAEAEPTKHRRWVTVSDGYGNGVATASICECSLCKDTIWVYKNDKRKWKFCPNCGARMDGGEND